MFKRLIVRSKTALIFGLVMLAFLCFNKELNYALIGLVYLFCTFEYLSLNKEMKPAHKWSRIVIIMGMLLLPFYFSLPAYLIPSIIILAIFYQLLTIYNLYLDKPILKHKTFSTLNSILYFGLSGMIAMFILRSESPWEMFLLKIFILIWISDSLAYLVGSKFGKRKLMPSISPNKTIEGTLGAGIFTMIAAITIAHFSDSSYYLWALYGITIWVLGGYGDLVESSIKRYYSIKDTGTLLPGHGGFFDRFDSFIFVWPVLGLIHLYISYVT